MVRFVDAETRVVVQGITGKQGRFHTKLMLEYGTKIVAGVTPGKGGDSVEGVPVYDTVAEALDRHRIDASIIFVPAPYAPDAVYEALDAGLDPIVVITEGIPIRDTMEFVARARKSDITIIGPNTPGVIKVGECKLGIMPARVFTRGKVGIISRSGTLTYEIADHISRIGLGESTCVGLGGDPITGLDFIDALRWFEEDPQTDAVVLIGEIGGDAEERAAEFIAEGGFTKPAVAYIAGRTAIPGKRMGHAGAIIQGERGTARSKIEALESAEVPVAEKPSDVARILKGLLS
ncbi:succinate--CoA ligase subunit alpha [Candidatus Bathyarchaeota archaeon]|nr:succinate--CoA ligase subunit alpha [Candidatus Bathyarchaeota archaeon]